MILKVDNSAAGPHVVTVRKGVNPPAFRAGIGDLAVTVTNGTTQYIGPLESARFSQADGSLLLDFDSGTTGTITAFFIPVKW